jgi:hypothetical protein
MYLSNAVPERNELSRLSLKAEDIARASLRLGVGSPMVKTQGHRAKREDRRFGLESRFAGAVSHRIDGRATEVPTTSNNLEKEGHMRQARYRFFLLPLFLVSGVRGSFAQANSEVTGIVTDQTGAVVAERKIVAHQSADKRSPKRPQPAPPVCTTSRIEPRQLQPQDRGQGLRNVRPERDSGERVGKPRASTSSSRSARKPRRLPSRQMPWRCKPTPTSSAP